MAITYKKSVKGKFHRRLSSNSNKITPYKINELESKSTEEYISKNKNIDYSVPFIIRKEKYEELTNNSRNILSLPVMQSLQNFFPYSLSQANFWPRYSLARDGASLNTLLSKVKDCKWTIIAIETTKGEIFGSFNGSPWRVNPNYYGSTQSFLWRLVDSDNNFFGTVQDSTTVRMEVYPHSNIDNYTQLCQKDGLRIGGGDFEQSTYPHPYPSRSSELIKSKGIGLSIEQNIERGSSRSCATYLNRPLCELSDSDGGFEIYNLEVWTVTPCMYLEDATKVEQSKLYVEKAMNKQRTTRAEMYL